MNQTAFDRERPWLLLVAGWLVFVVALLLLYFIKDIDVGLSLFRVTEGHGALWIAGLMLTFAVTLRVETWNQRGFFTIPLRRWLAISFGLGIVVALAAFALVFAFFFARYTGPIPDDFFHQYLREAELAGLWLLGLGMGGSLLGRICWGLEHPLIREPKPTESGNIVGYEVQFLAAWLAFDAASHSLFWLTGMDPDVSLVLKPLALDATWVIVRAVGQWLILWRFARLHPAWMVGPLTAGVAVRISAHWFHAMSPDFFATGFLAPHPLTHFTFVEGLAVALMQWPLLRRFGRRSAAWLPALPVIAYVSCRFVRLSTIFAFESRITAWDISLAAGLLYSFLCGMALLFILQPAASPSALETTPSITSRPAAAAAAIESGSTAARD